MQPFWRAIWNYAQKCVYPLTQQYLFWIESPRDHKNRKVFHMCKIIYSSSLCGGLELEIKGMLINLGMTDQVVVFECNGILLCYKKYWTG